MGNEWELRFHEKGCGLRMALAGKNRVEVLEGVNEEEEKDLGCGHLTLTLLLDLY